MSHSYSESNTFTTTHAKHIASKVATDLKRIQRFYGSPSDSRIEQYELEIIELLKKGYLDTVTYGFQKNGKWIEPTLYYVAKDLVGSSTSDDPGKIQPNANIEGATFCSYLTYNSKWNELSPEEKDEFEKSLPFKRVGGDKPEIIGYFTSDKTYSSGGKVLERSILKNS